MLNSLSTQHMSIFSEYQNTKQRVSCASQNPESRKLKSKICIGSVAASSLVLTVCNLIFTSFVIWRTTCNHTLVEVEAIQNAASKQMLRAKKFIGRKYTVFFRSVRNQFTSILTIPKSNYASSTSESRPEKLSYVYILNNRKQKINFLCDSYPRSSVRRLVVLFLCFISHFTEVLKKITCMTTRSVCWSQVISVSYKKNKRSLYSCR